MTALSEQIYRTIQDLPIEDKVQLVDKLLFSLTPASPETTQAWIQESEKRLQKFRAGSSKALDKDLHA
jgi:hypothetical protein